MCIPKRWESTSEQKQTNKKKKTELVATINRMRTYLRMSPREFFSDFNCCTSCYFGIIDFRTVYVRTKVRRDSLNDSSAVIFLFLFRPKRPQCRGELSHRSTIECVSFLVRRLGRKIK